MSQFWTRGDHGGGYGIVHNILGGQRGHQKARIRCAGVLSVRPMLIRGKMERFVGVLWKVTSDESRRGYWPRL